MVTTRLQNILIAILAVVAVGLSLLAFRSVNAVGGTPEQSLPPVSAPPVDDNAAATTAAGDDAAVTSEAPEGPTAAGWLEALAGDGSNLLVVGDGYSHLPEQWVQRWADLVSADRPVAIRHWGEAADTSFNEPIELSEGDGPSLTVWSASRDRSSVADAVERYARFVSASAEPDAVLVSLGQASDGEDVATELDALLDEVGDVPVIVTLGGAGLYDEAVGADIAAWAQDHADTVVLVDLRSELGDDATPEDWAQAFADALR